LQFKHFFWLFPLAILGLWESQHLMEWPVDWQRLVHYAPVVLSGLGIFISFYLNRIQPLMFFATLLMAGVGMDFIFPGHQFGHASPLFFPLFTLWLPLIWLLWALMPERGVKNAPYLLLSLFLLVLPAYGLQWAVQLLSFEWARWVSLPVSSDRDFWLQLPRVSALVALGVLAILIVRLGLLKTPKVIDSTLVVVYLLILYGLNAYSQTLVFDWMLTVSAGLLLLSMIFDAHFIAYNDELTGLNGRRALLESFDGLGRKYAIAMVDIDHFKKFNDTFGHDIGDLALRQVAEVLSHIKGGGRVYRYGGEEFTVLFPRKTAEEALPYLQQLCELMASTLLRFQQDGKTVQQKITISIGVADRQDAKTPEEVMKCADEALYVAKKSGRDQVKIYVEKPTKKATPKKQTKKETK